MHTARCPCFARSALNMPNVCDWSTSGEMRDSEFMGAGIGRADGGDLLRVLAGVSDDPLGLPSGVADYGLGFAQSLSRLGANDSGLHTGLSEDFLRMHAGFSGGTHLFPRLLEQLTGLGFLPRVLHAGDDFA